MDHLPVGDPLAAGAFALLAFGAGERALHAGRDAGFRPDGNVRLHAALPQREVARQIWRVHGATHAVFVVRM